MSYEIKFIKENGIIEIKNKYDISYEKMITQTQEVIKLQHEKNTSLILTDFSSVKVNVDVNLSDIFQFPELYEQMGMDRKSKIAVLVSEMEVKTEELDFYETVCLNRGWNIRIFLKKTEAIEWLLSE